MSILCQRWVNIAPTLCQYRVEIVNIFDNLSTIATVLAISTSSTLSILSSQCVKFLNQNMYYIFLQHQQLCLESLLQCLSFVALGMSIFLLVNQVEAVMVSFITTFCLHVWHARKHGQTNTKIFCEYVMIIEKYTFVPAFVPSFPFGNLFWLVNLILKLFIWCPLMFLFDNITVDFRPGEKRKSSQKIVLLFWGIFFLLLGFASFLIEYQCQMYSVPKF